MDLKIHRFIFIKNMYFLKVQRRGEWQSNRISRQPVKKYVDLKRSLFRHLKCWQEYSEAQNVITNIKREEKKCSRLTVFVQGNPY